MQFDPNQSRSRKEGPGGDTGLNGANGPLVAVTQEFLDERLGTIFSNVHRELRSALPGVKGSFVSVQDLLYAGLNGLTSEVQFIVPPPPTLASQSAHPYVGKLVSSGAVPGETIVVTAQENPKLFGHLLWRMQTSGQYPDEDIAAVKQSGVGVVTPEFFLEYLDILQDASRYLRREASRLGPEMAEYTAIMALKHLQRGVNPIGWSKSLIRISAADSENLTLAVLNTPVNQELGGNATVFLAGAGYNALGEIPTMRAARDHTFVLNDRDEFVSLVLEFAARYSGASNVRVMRGDMSDALNRCDSVDSIIVSNVPSASANEITSFGRVADRKLKLGAPVHVCQAERPVASGFVPASTWMNLFKVIGFSTVADGEGQGSAVTISPKERAAWVDESPAEIAAKIQRADRFLVPCPFRYYAGRHSTVQERQQN